VDEHRHPRITRHVPGPLALGFGVHQQHLAVGVHPGQQGLGLTVGHQRHHGGQIRTLGQADNVIVERHLRLLGVRAPDHTHSGRHRTSGGNPGGVATHCQLPR